jgi:hypothetical protein
MIRLNSCQGCPAMLLKTPEQILKINEWHNLFLLETSQITTVKVILLGESYPEKRYFYDAESVYGKKGLRFNLKKEFGLETDEDLKLYFRNFGIVVYDCAFCPLHKLTTNYEGSRNRRLNTQIRHAATHCLKAYKLDYLKSQNAPIISFFPKNGGWLINEVKKSLPDLKARLVNQYYFNDLQGIKNAIELLLGK